MAGFLDLSIGGIISLVAVVTVTMIDKVGQGPAILIGLSVGLGCGLLNSALILTERRPDAGGVAVHHLRHEPGLWRGGPDVRPGRRRSS